MPSRYYEFDYLFVQSNIGLHREFLSLSIRLLSISPSSALYRKEDLIMIETLHINNILKRNTALP